MNTEQLQALFGERFLGREQINKMLVRMGMEPLGEADVPPLNFSEQTLKENASTHLLVLGYAGKRTRPLISCVSVSVSAPTPKRVSRACTIRTGISMKILCSALLSRAGIWSGKTCSSKAGPYSLMPC